MALWAGRIARTANSLVLRYSAKLIAASFDPRMTGTICETLLPVSKAIFFRNSFRRKVLNSISRTRSHSASLARFIPAANLRGEIWRQGRIENESARPIDKKASQVVRATHKCAGRPRALCRKCKRSRVTRAESPASATHPAAMRAMHSDGVGLVNDQLRAVAFGQSSKIGERGRGLPPC